MVTQRVVIVSRTRRSSIRGAASSLDASAAARRPNPSDGLRRATERSSRRGRRAAHDGRSGAFSAGAKRILSPVRPPAEPDAAPDGAGFVDSGSCSCAGSRAASGRGSRPWRGCSSSGARSWSTPTRSRGKWSSPGTPALAALVETFGPEILQPDGSLDRPALAGERLRRPTRPARSSRPSRIRRSARSSSARSPRRPPDGIVVHDVPLLVESKRGFEYDAVIVVEAPLRVAPRPARATRHAARRRASAASPLQATDEERREGGDVGGRQLRRSRAPRTQIDEIWSELGKRARAKAGRRSIRALAYYSAPGPMTAIDETQFGAALEGLDPSPGRAGERGARRADPSRLGAVSRHHVRRRSPRRSTDPAGQRDPGARADAARPSRSRSTRSSPIAWSGCAATTRCSTRRLLRRRGHAGALRVPASPATSARAGAITGSPSVGTVAGFATTRRSAPSRARTLDLHFDPADMPPGEFLTGAEAWLRCRAGEADPEEFGIFDMHGLWFVRGNVLPRSRGREQGRAAPVGLVGRGRPDPSGIRRRPSSSSSTTSRGRSSPTTRPRSGAVRRQHGRAAADRELRRRRRAS